MSQDNPSAIGFDLEAARRYHKEAYSDAHTVNRLYGEALDEIERLRAQLSATRNKVPPYVSTIWPTVTIGREVNGSGLVLCGRNASGKNWMVKFYEESGKRVYEPYEGSIFKGGLDSMTAALEAVAGFD